MLPRFSDLSVECQTPETLARDYGKANAFLDEGKHRDAIAAWDQAQRKYMSWSDLTFVHYTQNTQDVRAKSEKEQADKLAPVSEDHNVAFLKRLLADPDRATIEAIVGPQAIAIWQSNVATYDPIIAENMITEETLKNSYMGLVASARITIGDKTVSLPGLGPFSESLDRNIRYEAQKKRWQWFSDNGEAFDEIFDKAVKNRHEMAVKLGYENYIPLSEKLLGRTGFGAVEIAGFRQEIITHVVPLVSRIMENKRQEAGWKKVHSWDESLSDLKGNPKPVGDHDLQLERAKIMFSNMDSRLLDLYNMMLDDGFIDLQSRENKKNGGYCTSFPTTGQPFIFGNFNGTKTDTDVFSHEMGHAFQRWLSGKKQPLGIYHPMARDACEIPSLSLEFLCSPHIDIMLEDGVGDRFRRMHLENHIKFLPYCVCVDHFQYEIYTKPDATAAERHEIWRTLEKQYTPWVDYGDLSYPAMGGRWQAQPHYYTNPLYYLNYGLDLLVALQFKSAAKQDFKGTFDRYVALCERGGSAPFLDLVRDAGLVWPFEPGLVAKLTRDVAATLGVSTASPFGDRPGHKAVLTL